MTREQYIEKLESMLPEVFVAEDKIRDEWQERLEKAKDLTPVAREKLSKEYLHALATTMASKVTDAQLAEITE